MNIKTRFAPSPTGNLHFGNIRTALYSWLFARNQGGKFVLRIEDTNSQQSKVDFVKIIVSTLNWLNIDWDEGPYFQTDRLVRYASIIDYMIQNDMAYKCYCSVERLRLLRIWQMENGYKPKYDGHCSRITNVIKKNVLNTPYVVRFRNPTEGTVNFCDQIRGTIVFNNRELDDLIIRRVDGLPTYNFCVVVDDMDMGITHVIRGEEHINNTPRQINILKALDAPIPVYAHVSMILNTDRTKMSKRYDAMDIMQCRRDGFLPEAILNYLVKLGWSKGDQEIFTIDQMKKCFNLDAVNRSASIFSIQKLLWFNHYYINYLSVDYIASCLFYYMEHNNIDIKNGPKLVDIVKLFSKRAYTLRDIADNCDYFYKDFDLVNKQAAKRYLRPDAIKVLLFLREKFFNLVDWKLGSIKRVICQVRDELSIAMVDVGMPLRVALTGVDQSPALSETVYFVGQTRVLDRISQAIDYIYNTYLIKKK